MPDDIKEHGAPVGEIGTANGDSHVPAPAGHLNDDPAEASASVYSSSSDPYGQPGASTQFTAAVETKPPEAPAAPQALAPIPPKAPPPPPPPPPDDDEEPGDGEERGMLRMSFMGHLEELRSRILKAVAGLIIAFIACFGFCGPLWKLVSAPAVDALKHIGVNPPKLVAITPMEQFNVIYLKLPLLVSVFVASPWILLQVWGFISPGLYRREKRWAVPFILSTAGLFITGGCFAYFVAFRYGLEFLLGIGRDINVSPMVSINEYFDLFVNVTLGVGLVFEMPVIIFFLTLLRLASPRFLLRHSRYAILAITIIAAVVTPTPDIFNMMLFAVPMVLLFFVGLFASYLLVLNREGGKFPWRLVLIAFGVLVVLCANAVALMVWRFHYHFVQHWPFLTR